MNEVNKQHHNRAPLVIKAVGNALAHYADEISSVPLELALNNLHCERSPRHCRGMVNVFANLEMNHNDKFMSGVSRLTLAPNAYAQDDGFVYLKKENPYYYPKSAYYPIRVVEMFSAKLATVIQGDIPDCKMTIIQQSRQSYYESIHRSNDDPVTVLTNHLGLINLTFDDTGERFGVVLDFERMPSTQSRAKDFPTSPISVADVYIIEGITTEMEEDICEEFSVLERSSDIQFEDIHPDDMTPADYDALIPIQGRRDIPASTFNKGLEGVMSSNTAPRDLIAYFIAMSEKESITLPKPIKQVYWEVYKNPSDTLKDKVIFTFDHENGSSITASSLINGRGSDLYIQYMDTQDHATENAIRLLKVCSVDLINKVISDMEIKGAESGHIKNSQHALDPSPHHHPDVK